MNLAPRELDHMIIFNVAQLAQRRKDRGVKLNYSEAIALICDHALEGARDGRTVAELMSSCREVVTAEECMEGVPALTSSVQVECTFPDGTKLVSIHDPVQPGGK